MTDPVDSLLKDIPADLPEECCSLLAQADHVRIERIVSRGHVSPPGFWYDQEESEFVLLVRGAATVRFEDRPEPVMMRAGDWLVIAPHVRHRVDWTDPDQDSIWLAVYYR